MPQQTPDGAASYLRADAIENEASDLPVPDSAGDAQVQAFGRLRGRFEATVYRQLVQLTKLPTMARALTQEVFEQARVDPDIDSERSLLAVVDLVFARNSEAVHAEQVKQRILAAFRAGEDVSEVDPRRTALLEADARELVHLLRGISRVRPELRRYFLTGESPAGWSETDPEFPLVSMSLRRIAARLGRALLGESDPAEAEAETTTDPAEPIEQPAAGMSMGQAWAIVENALEFRLATVLDRIADLPPTQKTFAELRLLAGHTVEQVVAETDSGQQAVHTLQQRTILTLAKSVAREADLRPTVHRVLPGGEIRMGEAWAVVEDALENRRHLVLDLIANMPDRLQLFAGLRLLEGMDFEATRQAMGAGRDGVEDLQKRALRGLAAQLSVDNASLSTVWELIRSAVATRRGW